MKLQNIGITAASLGELPIKRVFHGDVFVWALLVTVWDGTEWSNGEPNINMVAIIDGHLDTSVQNNLICDYLQNNSTIVIAPGTFLTANQIHNNGSVVVEDKGNLLQHGNASFYTGNQIVVKSKTTPLFRLDFTYWASPINGFSLFAVSPISLFDKYSSWNALTQAWTTHRRGTSYPDVIMESGRGYIIRAPQNYALEGAEGAVAQVYEATFTGVPNTGEIQIPVYRANVNPDNSWNLLGNPYPSVFNWDLFYMKNHGVIAPMAAMWVPKQTVEMGGGLLSYPASWANYTPLGGTRANKTTGRPTGIMDIARSINVKALQASNVIFEDYMRVPTVNPLGIDKNRYWLNIYNVADTAFYEVLIGYVESDFSEFNFSYNESMSGTVAMRVVDNGIRFNILSRNTPFDATDKEVLEYKVNVAGNYTIAIPETDGLFDLTAIYLVDKLLNITTDLKEGNYTFNSAIGTFADRFEVKYQL